MLGAWIRIRAQKAGTKFRALQRSHVIYSALDHPDTRWLVRQLTEFATPASLSCRAGAAAERCWTPSVDAVLRGGPVDSRAGSLAGALEKRANTARRWCWGLRYAITRGAAFAHAAEHSGGASRCRVDSPAEQLWYADAALLPGRRSRCDVLDTLRGRRTACWPARMTCVPLTWAMQCRSQRARAGVAELARAVGVQATSIVHVRVADPHIRRTSLSRHVQHGTSFCLLPATVGAAPRGCCPCDTQETWRTPEA